MEKAQVGDKLHRRLIGEQGAQRSTRLADARVALQISVDSVGNLVEQIGVREVAEQLKIHESQHKAAFLEEVALEMKQQ